MTKRASVLTIMFYALIGALAISIVYDIAGIMKSRVAEVNKNIAEANYYRILALSYYVNATHNPVYADLDNCWVQGKNDSVIVACNNGIYMGKTNLSIIGFAKGKATIVKKDNYIEIVQR